MQHDPTRTFPGVFVWEGRGCLIATGVTHPQNFAETLPTEMSVKIFGELDAGSLCSASQTCKLWHDIIEECEQLWRRQCLLVRAVCQREVDGDRREGLSWKVTLVRNYTRSCLKRDWLRGRYSNVRSVEELSGRTMVPLDAETWGEILQAELDR
ncbi:F-box only protein 48 [Aulostomus maculatus]